MFILEFSGRGNVSVHAHGMLYIPGFIWIGYIELDNLEQPSGSGRFSVQQSFFGRPITLSMFLDPVSCAYMERISLRSGRLSAFCFQASVCGYKFVDTLCRAVNLITFGSPRPSGRIWILLDPKLAGYNTLPQRYSPRISIHRRPEHAHSTLLLYL